MRKPSHNRSYDATRRRRRSAETRERALAVACRLFAERGYRETTMEAIASEARMATPTLYAVFGSKHGILSGLLDRLVSGVPGGPSVLTTAEAREVFAEPEQRRALEKFAPHMDAIQERLGAIYDIMKDAARSEPDVGALYRRVQRNRYKNLEALAARLAERGPLRAGLSVEDAGRTIWVLASPEVRQMLLVDAGWSRGRYAKWLADMLCAALLCPPTSRDRERLRT